MGWGERSNQLSVIGNQYEEEADPAAPGGWGLAAVRVRGRGARKAELTLSRIRNSIFANSSMLWNRGSLARSLR